MYLWSMTIQFIVPEYLIVYCTPILALLSTLRLLWKTRLDLEEAVVIAPRLEKTLKVSAKLEILVSQCDDWVCIVIFNVSMRGRDVQFLRQYGSFPAAAIMQWLDEHLSFRLSILFAYLFGKSELAISILRYLGTFGAMCRESLQPLMSILRYVLFKNFSSLDLHGGIGYLLGCDIVLHEHDQLLTT